MQNLVRKRGEQQSACNHPFVVYHFVGQSDTINAPRNWTVASHQERVSRLLEVLLSKDMSSHNATPRTKLGRVSSRIRLLPRVEELRGSPCGNDSQETVAMSLLVCHVQMP